MNTRCKPGDLAIIAQDTDCCAANIGRLVKVRGPAAIDFRGRLTWLITPVDQKEPYLVEEPDGSIICMKPGDERIEHPDAWLKPLGSIGRGETRGEREEVGA